MKKQFSKDNFVFILDSLKKESDMISELYKEYNIDLIDCNWLLNETSVINLLEFIFDDEDTDWIGWWCWEKDFGRDKEIDVYYDFNDPIILDTPDQLYDFLIKNIEEKEDD